MHKKKLGFLGIFGIKSLAGVLQGDYLEAVWIAWSLRFLYLLPGENG